MNITFAPKGILQIDDARIIYRNFSGEGSKYNRQGDRNFAVVIETEEQKDALLEEGWNVKIKPPRDEDDEAFMYIGVKVKFNDRGPNVYLESGKRMNRLNEDSIECLDHVDILGVDLDIRPYDWEIEDRDGVKTGRAAYLQSMKVTQDVDRFADRFAQEEYPE